MRAASRVHRSFRSALLRVQDDKGDILGEREAGRENRAHGWFAGTLKACELPAECIGPSASLCFAFRMTRGNILGEREAGRENMDSREGGQG
jgi:hypothetical protein